MNSLRYQVKKKMNFFAATYKRCKRHPPDFSGSFFEGISDDFGSRDECVDRSVFTWRPHATDGVQGFLSHALNREEVSAKKCRLRQPWGLIGVNAYRNSSGSEGTFLNMKSQQSSIRGSWWNGEQRSTSVLFSGYILHMGRPPSINIKASIRKTHNYLAGSQFS